MINIPFLESMIDREVAIDRQDKADAMLVQVGALIDAVKQLQCFNCGCIIGKPLSEHMKARFLEHARCFDSGEHDRTSLTNIERYPFNKRGVCHMCDGVRQILEKPKETRA